MAAIMTPFIIYTHFLNIQLKVRLFCKYVDNFTQEKCSSMKPLEVSRDALRAEITYDPLVAHSAIQNTAKV